MSQILVPRFRPPRLATKGSDGLPDYVVAARDSPFCYTPLPGYRFTVFLGEERLWHIVEADRKRGFAIGLHYEVMEDGRRRVISHDEDGIPQHRMYEGRVIFRVERAVGG